MRAAWIAVALVWCAAAALDAIAGEGRGAQWVLALGSGGLACLLARGDRTGYLASFALASAGLVAVLIQLSLGRANLAFLQRLVYALVWLAFVAFLLLPATRRRFGVSAARAPERAAYGRRLAALVVHAVGLVVCALLLAAGVLYAGDGIAGIGRPYEPRSEPDPEQPELGAEWAMHPVENTGDLLPNGLDGADVNGDGWLDFVTNYELEGRLRIAFHPGAALERGRMWPALDVGAVTNAESSALGDLDRDGAVDVVAVHGVEAWDVGPGVRVYWGARSTGAGLGALRFRDAGDLPASTAGWHFLYTKAVDIDADGDLDIVAGGRAARRAFGRKQGLDDARLAWAGIRWFENPGARVRDLGLWREHAIDASARSGHGFELGDIDGDGDLDLANASSDFDTPEDEEDVVWYENPGPGLTAQAWPRHALLRSDEFYAKEQVAIGDLDGDGRTDVLAHAPERIYWFRNRKAAAGATPGFETLVIPKPAAARWRARPLELADLDGDGQLDVIGALIHHDGELPRDKAAVFWMKRQPDGWATRVIKWADGFRGLNAMNGEKWDQIVPLDVDRDGDLDLVANVEEYNRLRSILAVVWFENPSIAGPGAARAGR